MDEVHLEEQIENLESEAEEEKGVWRIAPLDLGPDELAKYRLALGRVRKLGDPVLQQVAKPVETFNGSLAKKLRKMESIMVDSDGAGIAGPQLGFSRRAFLYRLWDENDQVGPTQIVINPELLAHSQEKSWGPEGCLSIPSIGIRIERWDWIEFTYRTARGEHKSHRAEGFEARVIQHEWDHLDGVLISDLIGDEDRAEMIRLWNNPEETSHESSPS